MGMLAQGIVNGFSSAGIYILVALGLTLVLSIVSIVQMAHGEFTPVGSIACTVGGSSRLNCCCNGHSDDLCRRAGRGCGRFGFRPLQRRTDA